eukprot:CAMPEP_0175188220 /NCGR_PEP_ID=MMETSP0093-20121207/3310_1 /TAXON_ID=311494 /ORGANISM="Alexandrium monilatum, Strain CCMP3105" /LENGTH=412 /DNA_ID=CAMNT_0016480997 /DNA_START=153 /DNA_END=1391 /DNA_ORIENTATION=+
MLRASYLMGVMTAIAQGAIFDAYLLVLAGGSNTFVGTVESIRGMAALAAAVPLGWAADRWPKPRVLQYNAAFAVISAVPLAIGIARNVVWLVILGSVGLSLHNQCYNGGVPALLADLTAPGQERTAAVGAMNSLRNLGQASGPLLQLMLTLVLGTTSWTPRQLHWIICSGLFILVPYIAVLSPVWSGRTPRPQASAAGPALAEELRDTTGGPSREASPQASQPLAPVQRRRWLIAVAMELAAIVMFLGSGMTFKFFPLFFKGDFGFSPTAVCLFMTVLWLMAAAGAQVAPQVAKRIGRVRTVLLTTCVAAGLLFWVASGLPAWASALTVLVRAAFSQSSMPLMLAVVLDMVPPQHRGKWSAVVSLRRTSFAVSAFIGGQLSDHHDYRYAFFVTACVQLSSCLILFPVALLVS